MACHKLIRKITLSLTEQQRDPKSNSYNLAEFPELLNIKTTKTDSNGVIVLFTICTIMVWGFAASH